MLTNPIIIQVKTLMQEFSFPWFVVGGWAIDLFLDFESREHSDIEIGVFRCNQHDLREYLCGWAFTVIRSGLPGHWKKMEWLNLPAHELVATSSKYSLRKLEILLQEGDDENWIYRRNDQVKMSRSKTVITSIEGVPFLCPELVLLYKSKELRDKDDFDFETVSPELNEERKSWLKNALNACYSSHDWLNSL